MKENKYPQIKVNYKNSINPEENQLSFQEKYNKENLDKKNSESKKNFHSFGKNTSSLSYSNRNSAKFGDMSSKNSLEMFTKSPKNSRNLIDTKKSAEIIYNHEHNLLNKKENYHRNNISAFENNKAKIQLKYDTYPILQESSETYSECKSANTTRWGWVLFVVFFLNLKKH